MAGRVRASGEEDLSHTPTLLIGAGQKWEGDSSLCDEGLTDPGAGCCPQPASTST